MRGTFTNEAQKPSPGTVMEPRGTHETSGGWRAERGGELAKALLVAAAGGIAGLVGQTKRLKP